EDGDIITLSSDTELYEVLTNQTTLGAIKFELTVGGQEPLTSWIMESVPSISGDDLPNENVEVTETLEHHQTSAEEDKHNVVGETDDPPEVPVVLHSNNECNPTESDNEKNNFTPAEATPSEPNVATQNTTEEKNPNNEHNVHSIDLGEQFQKLLT